MATITLTVGQPTHDWQNVMDDVLFNGAFSNIGGGPQASITLAFGTSVLVITGTNLTVTAGRVLSAGSITSFTLLDNGQNVFQENGFAANITFTRINTLLSAYSGGTDSQQDAAFEAVFANEALTVFGSNDEYESLITSRFADTVFGNDGDEFVRGGKGNDLIDGGNGYDTLGFHGLGGGITVTMDINGVAGAGKVTGAIGTGIVNTSFVNMERVVGTENADTFVSYGFNATFDHDFNWVGGGGNDKFSNYSTTQNRNLGVNYDEEKFEFGQQQWGDDAGEFGVIVNLSSASVTANVGRGNQTVAVNRAVDTFNNIDTLFGINKFRLTDAADFFYGNDSGIEIQARGGNDFIRGGAGRDQVQGDEGNDNISTFDGNDDIDGGAGNDLIDAGGGEFDFINASSGTDTVNGNTGFDDYDVANGIVGTTLAIVFTNTSTGSATVTGTLRGEATNTTLTNIERIGGSDAAESFTVNAGFVATEESDRTFGGVFGVLGVVSAVGGGGADTFTDNSGVAAGMLLVDYRDEAWEHDDFDGYWGDSAGEFGVIVNTSAASITVNVGRGNQAVAAGRGRDSFNALDSFTNVRNFILTNSDDYLQAGAAGTFVRGRDGDDRINGGIGNDHLVGDDGNDTLKGNAGADELQGRNGDDTIDGGAGNDRINGDDGNDNIVAGTGRDDIDGSQGDDTINGDAGNDFINGGDGADVLDGGAGSDEVEGGSGDDTVNGGANSDRLYGDDGNDTINGGTGADEMYGWMGDDSYVVDNIGDQLFEDVGTGFDSVQSSVSYSLADSGEVEELILTGAANTNGVGNDFDNFLSGNSGVNTLVGGAGNDSLAGGGSSDVLVGGTGNDTFRFNAQSDGGDIVLDFNSADDGFAFFSASFGNLALGALGAGRFVATTADTATTANGRFFYETDTRTLRFDADGNGAGSTAVVIAILQDGATFAASDILII